MNFPIVTNCKYTIPEKIYYSSNLKECSCVRKRAANIFFVFHTLSCKFIPSTLTPRVLSTLYGNLINVTASLLTPLHPSDLPSNIVFLVYRKFLSHNCCRIQILSKLFSDTSYKHCIWQHVCPDYSWFPLSAKLNLSFLLHNTYLKGIKNSNHKNNNWFSCLLSTCTSETCRNILVVNKYFSYTL